MSEKTASLQLCPCPYAFYSSTVMFTPIKRYTLPNMKQIRNMQNVQAGSTWCSVFDARMIPAFEGSPKKPSLLGHARSLIPALTPCVHGESDMTKLPSSYPGSTRSRGRTPPPLTNSQCLHAVEAPHSLHFFPIGGM
jgi:hypothetical protein